jgi:predicted Fe-Mo cluster-binding NifX family protein
MKIAVSASSSSVDAELDERFGRCRCFVVADPEGAVLDPVENRHAGGSAAGIQAARLLADRGVSVVLTGRCGPNASDTLEAAGIQVVTGCGGIVRRVLDRFLAEVEESEAISDGRTPDGAKTYGQDGRSRSQVKNGRGARQRDFEEDGHRRGEWCPHSLPGI